MLILSLNRVFRLSVSLRLAFIKGLGGFSIGKTMTYDLLKKPVAILHFHRRLINAKQSSFLKLWAFVWLFLSRRVTPFQGFVSIQKWVNFSRVYLLSLLYLRKFLWNTLNEFPLFPLLNQRWKLWFRAICSNGQKLFLQ